MGAERVRLEIFQIALLSFALVGLSLYLQGNIGFNMADEGILWYVSKHTAHGGVPLRDFQSYDPGRYYWIALWSYFFGDGILAMRISTAIFQAVGITFGLLAARRSVKSFPALVLVGLVLNLWIFPRYKAFEPSLAMAGVFFAVRLIEKPSLLRHFSAGLCVGLAAFFARNFGLYLSLSFFLLIIFIWFKNEDKNLPGRYAAWLAGIAAGYLPMFFMLFFINGFFESFINSVLWIFTHGTNLHTPIPWPWNTNSTNEFFTGLLFLFVPIFYLFSALSFLWASPSKIFKIRLLVASTFVGIFCLHHAFARADLNHLAQSIHPFILAMIALPISLNFVRKKTLIAVITIFFLLTTFFSVVKAQPYYTFLLYKDMYVRSNISGDSIWINRYSAYIIYNIKLLVKQHVGSDDEILLAPYMPGMYCILNRKSPLWLTYFVLPEPKAQQHEMIKNLKEKNVKWALISTNAIDRRDDLGFRNTHRLVWQYFMENFERVATPMLPPIYLLLHKRENP